MEFTEAFPAVGGLVQASSCGRWIGKVVQKDLRYYVVVQSASNGILHRRFAIPMEDGNPRKPCAPITNQWNKVELLWSPNNRRIVLANYVLCKIMVFDTEIDLDVPICTVTENSMLGVERILWVPDSLQFLTVMRFRVKL